MSMKRVFSLAMAATMLLSATAFGATVDGTNPSDLEKGTDGKFHVTYTGATDGKEYMIWAVKERHESVADVSFAQANVLYINQNTADGSSVTFDGFLPMKSEEGTVLITGQGMEAPIIVGYIKAEGNTIEGEIGLQNRVKNFGGAEIVFYKAGTNEVVDSVTTDENNKFKITLPNGTYKMSITRAGFLSYTKTEFTVNSDTVWSEEFEIELVVGDVDGNGRITSDDYFDVADLLGQRGQDLTEDVDGNGRITSDDYFYVADNLGKRRVVE